MNYESMSVIIKYTIGNVTVSEYLEVKKQMDEQKSSELPVIINLIYYPNTQILELTQIEDK